MLHLCGFSLLHEDDLLLELCLVYGVDGLLLLSRCLWGERLWVLWRSGMCLHPVFLSLMACLSVLGCLERLVLLSLWCILMLDCAGRRLVAPQLIFIVLVVDFCSTSRFYIYIVCVDRTGSLSSGAFNQLRLATLNIVLTILY